MKKPVALKIVIHSPDFSKREKLSSAARIRSTYMFSISLMIMIFTVKVKMRLNRSSIFQKSKRYDPNLPSYLNPTI